MKEQILREVKNDSSHIRGIIADNNRSALRLEAEGLLKMQPELKMAGRGYTQEQADTMQRAVREGALKLDGLREVRIEDHAGRKSICWIGDDQEWVSQFMGPTRIGKFGNPSQFAKAKQWWQK